jgi:23S rRNA (cytosine1962-C5)-methyltransferase
MKKYLKKKTIFQVRENGLAFIVNLSDYVDTGLFLDHRINRELVRASAANKNVLNLFAYTGSFSVYAAAGGALKVTTVDLSNTYLNWAKENFKANNMPVQDEDFIKADVKEWVKQDPSTLYDIVVLDPPTISRSKMSRSSFDVQRDHPELLFHVLRHMHPGGVLYFSTNFREFEFSPKRLQVSSIEDITLQSIPEDFRNKKIHYCWRITK